MAAAARLQEEKQKIIKLKQQPAKRVVIQTKFRQKDLLSIALDTEVSRIT